MMKGNRFSVCFICVFMLFCGLAMPAYALSDVDYVKFKKESPEFATADRELQIAWNELKPLIKGEVKKNLLQEQQEWLKNDRDIRAAGIMNVDESLSRVDAYTKVTEGRATSLKLFADQLRSPDRPVSVRGVIMLSHNDASALYALEISNCVAYYTLCLTWNVDETSISQAEFDQYIGQETPVEVSGILLGVEWFDHRTLKIHPLK